MIWKTALLALALTGCGMSTNAHHKALDDQKSALMAESTAKQAALHAEFEKVRAELAAAQVVAVEKATADYKEVNQIAWNRAKAALAAATARESQLSTLARKFDDALRQAEEALKAAREQGLDAAVAALEEATAALRKKDGKVAAEKLSEGASWLQSAAK